jgi:hypothetical protein
VVVVKQEISAQGRSQNASAAEALEEARKMPPGAQRTDALKKLACFDALRTVMG